MKVYLPAILIVKSSAMKRHRQGPSVTPLYRNRCRTRDICVSVIYLSSIYLSSLSLSLSLSLYLSIYLSSVIGQYFLLSLRALGYRARDVHFLCTSFTMVLCRSPTGLHLGTSDEGNHQNCYAQADSSIHPQISLSETNVLLLILYILNIDTCNIIKQQCLTQVNCILC